jgi:hypothetical protein
VNQAVLQHLDPEHVEVEICRAEELEQRRGLTSELDEMWSYVGKKAEPRWLWHAINHQTGTVLAYVFGRRQDEVFLQLQAILAPFGISPEHIARRPSPRPPSSPAAGVESPCVRARRVEHGDPVTPRDAGRPA